MASGDGISLRVSLLHECQMRCGYCRPGETGRVLPVRGLRPAAWMRRIRAIAGAVPVTRIRLTGGEPLLYDGLEEVIGGCARLGVPDIAMTSNGLGLARRAWTLRESGLGRVNISLDGVDPAVFRTITGASLAPVLRGIDAAVDAGFPVKLNAVVMRGLNDAGAIDLLAYAADKGVPIRFLEMMPIGAAAATFKDHYISGREIMDRLRAQVSLAPLPYTLGATSRDFQAHWPDGRTAVCGFILPTSTPFCDGCRRLRLNADGELLGCLAQPDRLDIDKAVAAAEDGDFEPMRAALSAAMAVKQRPPAFESQQSMVRVGG